MGQTLSGLRVCRWEGASESQLSFVLLYLFLCRVSLWVCTSLLRVPVSFPVFSICPNSHPPPILYLFLHQLPHPPLTERKASPSPRQGRVDLGGPASPDWGQIRPLTAPALREEGVPKRGPLTSP